MLRSKAPTAGCAAPRPPCVYPPNTLRCAVPRTLSLRTPGRQGRDVRCYLWRRGLVVLEPLVQQHARQLVHLWAALVDIPRRQPGWRRARAGSRVRHARVRRTRQMGGHSRSCSRAAWSAGARRPQPGRPRAKAADTNRPPGPPAGPRKRDTHAGRRGGVFREHRCVMAGRQCTRQACAGRVRARGCRQNTARARAGGGGISASASPARTHATATHCPCRVPPAARFPRPHALPPRRLAAARVLPRIPGHCLGTERSGRPLWPYSPPNITTENCRALAVSGHVVWYT